MIQSPMTQRIFCTLFDSYYLIKGVAMLKSLTAHCPQAKVYVLCLDAAALQTLKALNMPQLFPLTLDEIEDDALRAVKPHRSLAEYCWTLTPCLPHYLLARHAEIDAITYLDADLLFYSSPEPLFEEIGGASIAIIEHRFTPQLREELEPNGRFCVEWVTFRRNEEGLACLARWREQCLDWCYAIPDAGRMGDQKYLEEWPERYRACHILEHLGAGVAPWNYAQYEIVADAAGALRVDGAPLIFYHFHQFQLLDDGGFERVSDYYAKVAPPPAPIYDAYETQLVAALRDIRSVIPGFSGGLKPAPRASGWRRFLPRALQSFLGSAVAHG